METQEVLNGCGWNQQSPQTPFEYGLARGIARQLTSALKKQTSNEGDYSLAFTHTPEPLYKQVGECRKIAHVFSSVNLFVVTKLLFRVFSNQDSSRVSIKFVKLNAGFIVCVRATPSVAVFVVGSDEQVSNGNDRVLTTGPLNRGSRAEPLLRSLCRVLLGKAFYAGIAEQTFGAVIAIRPTTVPMAFRQ